jgi:hypothetical protein
MEKELECKMKKRLHTVKIVALLSLLTLLFIPGCSSSDAPLTKDASSPVVPASDWLRFPEYLSAEIAESISFQQAERLQAIVCINYGQGVSEIATSGDLAYTFLANLNSDSDAENAELYVFTYRLREGKTIGLYIEKYYLEGDSLCTQGEDHGYPDEHWDLPEDWDHLTAVSSVRWENARDLHLNALGSFVFSSSDYGTNIENTVAPCLRVVNPRELYADIDERQRLCAAYLAPLDDHYLFTEWSLPSGDAYAIPRDFFRDGPDYFPHLRPFITAYQQENHLLTLDYVLLVSATIDHEIFEPQTTRDLRQTGANYRLSLQMTPDGGVRYLANQVVFLDEAWLRETILHFLRPEVVLGGEWDSPEEIANLIYVFEAIYGEYPHLREYPLTVDEIVRFLSSKFYGISREQIVAAGASWYDAEQDTIAYRNKQTPETVPLKILRQELKDDVLQIDYQRSMEHTFSENDSTYRLTVELTFDTSYLEVIQYRYLSNHRLH